MKKVEILILCLFLFAQSGKAIARGNNNGLKGQDFPNIEISDNGKVKPLSLWRSSPVFILVADPRFPSFARIKSDFQSAIPYLKKNSVKYLLFLLNAPKEKIDWPHFIDKDQKISSFFKLPQNGSFSFFVLDPKGKVALLRRDVHSPIMDIPKIMQIYDTRQAYKKGVFTINYTEHPKAPNIEAVDIKGQSFRLFDQQGKVVLLVFFSIDCIYCRQEMPILVELAKKEGLVTVGICSSGNQREIEEFMKDFSLPFTIIKNTDREIFRRFSSLSTPESFIIDREGYIVYNHKGMSGDLKNILSIELDKALGVADPGFLPSGVYWGARVCRSCHSKEYKSWVSTPHSVSFSSLARDLPLLKSDFSKPELFKKLAADNILVNSGNNFKFNGINSEYQLLNALRKAEISETGPVLERWRLSRAYLNPECQECHVTGFKKEGGFFTFRKDRYLIDVQCEVCHGIAGGHLSQEKGAREKEDYRKICLSCHNDKYSLKYSFDKSYELILHTKMNDLSEYPEEVRRRIIRTQMRERSKKVRLGVAYVGSQACRRCHDETYESWKKTGHSRSYQTLLAKGKQKEITCLRCHTTGYGQQGGFDIDKQKNNGLNMVGCEVCHGPGGDHVVAKEGDLKETIFGLSGKCKYCVIQNICQACHDRKNSPEFDIDSYLKSVKHQP